MMGRILNSSGTLPRTEMCSGSEAGSHLKLIDFVYHLSRLESNKEDKELSPALTPAW